MPAQRLGHLVRVPTSGADDGSTLGRCNLLATFTNEQSAAQGPSIPAESFDEDDTLEAQHDDFLELMTLTSHLYRQQETLTMQGHHQPATALGQGAVSSIATFEALNIKPSNVDATKTTTTKIEVVIKRTNRDLFNDGRVDPAVLKPLLKELKILIHPELRRHDNVVTILGIYWDFYQDGLPHPLLILEKGISSLTSFQKENAASMPTETKCGFSLDICQGIRALHRCGVIHGDVRPDNVLIFQDLETKRYYAKLADFSHSVFDTGAVVGLPGYSVDYHAPEYSQELPTGQLKLIDVYSTGLVIARIFSGHSLRELLKQKNNGMTDKVAVATMIEMKQNNTVATVLGEFLAQIDVENPMLHLEGIWAIREVIESTVTSIPQNRDLDKAISLLARLLAAGENRNKSFVQARLATLNAQPSTQPIKVWETITADKISIPYNSLQTVSEVVIDYLASELLRISASSNDPRHVQARRHLGILKLSDRACREANEADKITKHFLIAAEEGDAFSQAFLGRITSSLSYPVNVPKVAEYLTVAALKGSSVALQSLHKVNPEAGDEIAAIIKQRLKGSDTDLLPGVSTAFNGAYDPSPINARGDTLLHYWASVGDVNSVAKLIQGEILPEFLNQTNAKGDTPLICATRAGHPAILYPLLQAGADASIANRYNENPLHFLPSLSPALIESSVQAFLAAGAQLFGEARGFTEIDSLALRPEGDTCPIIRAVYANRPDILRILFKLANAAQDSVGIPAYTCLSILKWAVSFRMPEILAALEESIELYQPTVPLSKMIESLSVWQDNTGTRPIVAVCISGVKLTLDIPNVFAQRLLHGNAWKTNLLSCLNFIERHHKTVFSLPCQNFPNALCFAIAQNNVEAATYLMERHCFAMPGQSLPSVYNQLRFNLCNIDATDIAQGWKAFLLQKAWCKKVNTWPAAFLEIYHHSNAYYEEPAESYADLPRGWLLDGALKDVPFNYSNIMLKAFESEVTNPPPCSHIVPCIRPTDVQWGWLETTDQAIMSHPLSEDIQAGRTLIDPKPLPEFAEESSVGDEAFRDEHDIEESARIQGILSAVLTAILYGRRQIFRNLLQGAASEVLQYKASKADKVFVYHEKSEMNKKFVDASQGRIDNRQMARWVRTNVNKVGQFLFSDNHAHVVLERTWSDLQADKHLGFGKKKTFSLSSLSSISLPSVFPQDIADTEQLEYDGVIPYCLMFLTAITRSIHMDITLARDLLSHMTSANIDIPNRLTPRNWFEEECLRLDNSSGQGTPLYHASALKWTAMTTLLLQKGSSPQTPCFYRPRTNSAGLPIAGFSGPINEDYKPLSNAFPYKSTVIARVIVSTQNKKNEVTNLVHQAISCRAPRSFELLDVAMIVLQRPNPAAQILWMSSRETPNAKSLHWIPGPGRILNRDFMSLIETADAVGGLRVLYRVAKPRILQEFLLEVTNRRHDDILLFLQKLGFNLDRLLYMMPYSPLDLVSWTNKIPEQNISTSAHLLVEQDRRIIWRLQSSGISRSWFLTWERRMIELITPHMASIRVLAFVLVTVHAFLVGISSIAYQYSLFFYSQDVEMKTSTFEAFVGSTDGSLAFFDVPFGGSIFLMVSNLFYINGMNKRATAEEKKYFNVLVLRSIMMSTIIVIMCFVNYSFLSDTKFSRVMRSLTAVAMLSVSVFNIATVRMFVGQRNKAAMSPSCFIQKHIQGGAEDDMYSKTLNVGSIEWLVPWYQRNLVGITGQAGFNLAGHQGIDIPVSTGDQMNGYTDDLERDGANNENWSPVDSYAD